MYRAGSIRTWVRAVSAAAVFISITTGGLVIGALTATEAHADTLGYTWFNAPCEFGTAGGAHCANPANPKNDLYDWGEINSAGKFTPHRNGYEYRNCTDYVQWRESQVGVSIPSNLGNGGQWYSNAPASERSLTPKPWDAAVVPGNPGHVAFVESVNVDGTITVSEYNHDTQGDGDTRTGKAAAMGFTEFLDFGKHPAAVSNFKVTPSSLPASGGSVAFSAQVTNGQNCVLTVSRISYDDLMPSCDVKGQVTIPANTTKTALSYTFSLSVGGPMPVSAVPAMVTVAAGGTVPAKLAGTSWTAWINGVGNGNSCASLTFTSTDWFIEGQDEGPYTPSGNTLNLYSGSPSLLYLSLQWNSSTNEYYSPSSPFFGLSVTLVSGVHC
jgi:surface antigen